MPSVGTNLPEWIASGHQGGIKLGASSYTAGASAPLDSSTGATVLVLAPLAGVIESAASDLGFHIDQLLTSVTDEGSTERDFVRQEDMTSMEPEPGLETESMASVHLTLVDVVPNPEASTLRAPKSPTCCSSSSASGRLFLPEHRVRGASARPQTDTTWVSCS